MQEAPLAAAYNGVFACVYCVCVLHFGVCQLLMPGIIICGNRNGAFAPHEGGLRIPQLPKFSANVMVSSLEVDARTGFLKPHLLLDRSAINVRVSTTSWSTRASCRRICRFVLVLNCVEPLQ